MIQRKQTLFLILSLVATVLCLCMQIASLTPQGMGVDRAVYNFYIEDGNGGYSYSVWPLAVVLLLSCPLNLLAIFDYKKRKRQARECLFGGLLMVVWYVVYAILAFTVFPDFSFSVCVFAAFPFVALVGYVLARKGVLADEALVRAADRIR